AAVGELLPVVVAPPGVHRPGDAHLRRLRGGQHLQAGGAHPRRQLGQQSLQTPVDGDDDRATASEAKRRARANGLVAPSAGNSSPTPSASPYGSTSNPSALSAASCSSQSASSSGELARRRLPIRRTRSGVASAMRSSSASVRRYRSRAAAPPRRSTVRW